jgi:hypothetical protein
MSNMRCFCCDKSIQTDIRDEDSPTTLYPAYDALWFRAYGNFGSTLFDPIPGQNRKDAFLQILICDECVARKSEQITYIHNIRHHETADEEPFKL